MVVFTRKKEEGTAPSPAAPPSTTTIAMPTTVPTAVSTGTGVNLIQKLLSSQLISFATKAATTAQAFLPHLPYMMVDNAVMPEKMVNNAVTVRQEDREAI
eukprot:8694206-Ditylum_brightwellii.AAC.1